MRCVLCNREDTYENLYGRGSHVCRGNTYSFFRKEI